MKDNSVLTFPELLSTTLKNFGDRPAIALVGEKPLSYTEFDGSIKALIAWMEELGIQQGDKVAILSISIPNWAISYMAIACMGAITVPILPDFHPSDIRNILEHSDTKAIFVSDGLKSKLSDLPAEIPITQIRIDDFTLAGDTIGKPIFTPGALPKRQYNIKGDDLAAIIYTSGTTGKSKGVMLTHHNICFNAAMGGRVQELNETDRFLSILPLSHTYENTIGLILPMMKGSCIYYLGKTPSPTVLLPALREIKPTVMLTVPLIIEKIFRNTIKPKFTGNILLRIAIHIPSIRRKLNLIAGKKLMETFGGHIRFFGVGGAKLNKTVEKFLIEAKFPYAVGYGLTETSPLLAGFNPQTYRLQSTGPAIDGIELKINDPDPKSGEGEIWAKGPNVMKGYYKEQALTDEVITPDGWFRTGDLGIFDKDGYLFIRGRLKNMIVRSGGENIYPEEIESVMNNFRHVLDSLVVDRKGKLTALVYFNREEIGEQHRHLKAINRNYVEHEIEKLCIEIQAYVNHRVNKYSQIQAVIVQPEPFEKTATQKIKRYLYT
jgi:long-chain acyl-CoA synthetase